MTIEEFSVLWSKYEISPLNQLSFCQSIGMKLPTFQYWRRKLFAQKDDSPSPFPSSGRFVEIFSEHSNLSRQFTLECGPFKLHIPEDSLVSVLTAMRVSL